MAVDTGGPAFPVPPRREKYGMTLLDYFAAKCPINPIVDVNANDTRVMNVCKINVMERYTWAEMMIAEKRRREALP